MLNYLISINGATKEFEKQEWIDAIRSIRLRPGQSVDAEKIISKVSRQLDVLCEMADFYKAIEDYCLSKNSHNYQRVAGYFYARRLRIKVYEDKVPTVKQMHARLVDLGLMIDLGYTDDEYAQIEQIIQHDRDDRYTHHQIHAIHSKYSISNRVTKLRYETPQFVYMREACALASTEKSDKLLHLKNWYDELSLNRISSPTPNHLNLGTPQRSFASCCLFTVDDTVQSLGTADLIVTQMTAASAGLGMTLMTRSVGDPIRRGQTMHRGKHPYMASYGLSTKTNTQNGRNGSITIFFPGFDPEVKTILPISNPTTTEEMRNRNVHMAFMANRLLVKKVVLDEKMFLFNIFTAPALTKLFFSGDKDGFEKLYRQLEADESFPKTWVPAREIAIELMRQRQEVSTFYRVDIDEMNRHTSFKQPIYGGNLCVEISQPTHPYQEARELWDATDQSLIVIEEEDPRNLNHYASKHGGLTRSWGGDTFVELDDGKKIRAIDLQVGQTYRAHAAMTFTKVLDVIERKQQPEISLCSLAALIPSNIENDEQYEKSAYYALKMIDKCIHMSKYPFPHLEYTVKRRMNAGVGIIGLANYMARKDLKFSTLEGRKEIHRVFERHMHFLIRASIKLGQELGNAPWIDKTKWPDGWTPVQTYCRAVDEICPPEYHYDWDETSRLLKLYGGGRFSSLFAQAPTESSSKATGMTNGTLPIRKNWLLKLDADMALDWVAPDSDELEGKYEFGFDIPVKEQIYMYAVQSKWMDQSGSADIYMDRNKRPIIKDTELLDEFVDFTRYGLKSTYYCVTESHAAMAGKKKPQTPNTMSHAAEEEEACAGGCTI